MTDRDLVIKAVVDSTQATAGITEIVQNLGILQAELAKLSKGQQLADLTGLAAQYEEVYGPRLARNIRDATDALAQFEKIRAGTLTKATGPGAGFLKAVRTGQGGLDPATSLKALTPTQNELSEATARATAFLQAQAQAVEQVRQQFLELSQEAPAAYQNLIVQQNQSVQLEQQIQAIMGGSAVEQTLNRRRDILNQVNNELLEQRAALEGATRAQLSPSVQKTLEAGLQKLRRQNELLEQAALKGKRILEIENEIAAIRGVAAGSLLNVRDLASQERLGSALENIRKTSPVELGKDEEGKIAKINRLFREQNDLRKRASALGDESKRALGQEKIQTAIAGQLPFLQEIERRQGRLIAQREQLFTPGGLGRIAPELLQQISLLRRLSQELETTAKGTARFDQLQRQLRQTIERINATVASGGGGAAISALDPKTFQAGVEASMSGMQRLFQRVFSDLGRRFTATLQFALSAAILFGIQRFLREFLQTAIEVERAFADIETALSLDIDAERGTVEFKRQVEEVRQDVLLLAQDFNVLPTEANEAAFKMVARFDDVGNAMQALRAQLLATKVSTIEQGEVLRALTAVAEGFAAATLEANDSLTLQERLIQRETEAARGYGAALDLAVHIQQQFGIEVEDTLEGTARATEVFRQMGFTLAETQAIVASTSRQLGQTGVQAAERLVRSLGQLTDPKIRNALIDLAASSEGFSLAISDFDSGAKAWKAIVDQFARLEQVDPGAARQILQIIGQRRELEAVAAALGTADLQESIVGGQIEAIGAAEERFSFLEKTASETLKSISVGFQELAQNFERLGGLASVKLFLATLDQIIIFINETLKLVVDLFDAIDNAFGFDFTGTTRAIISVAAALALALKIAKELRVTFLALTGTQLGTRIGQLLGSFFVAKGAGAAAASGLLGPTGAPIAVGGAVAGGKLAALASAAGSASVGIGVFVGAVALAVISIKALNDKTRILAESFRAGTADIQSATAEALGEIRRQGLERGDPEAERIIHTAQLEAAKAWATSAESAIPSVFERIGADLARFKPSNLGKRLSDVEEIQQIERRLNFPEEIPGGREFWLARVNELDTFLIKDLTNAFKQELGDVSFSEEQIEAIQREINFGSGPAGFGGGGPIKGPGRFRIESQAELSELFTERIDRALARLEEDTGTAAGNAARNAGVEAEIDLILDQWNATLGAAGLLVSDISRSINALQAELDQLDTDVKLGRRHPGTVEGEQRRIAKLLLAEAEDLEASPSSVPGEVVDAFKKADAALIAAGDSFIKTGDQLLKNGAEARTEQEQRALEILVLSARVAKFTREGRHDLALDAQNELNEKLKEETLFMLQAAITAAELAKTMAVTLRERQNASRQLQSAILRLADFWKNFGDEQAADAQEARALTEARARREEARDQLNKQLQAQVRLRAPALSPIAQLKASVVAAQQALAAARRAGDPGDADAARQTLRELAAQQAQLELRTIVAAAKARAGTRDSLEQQGIALGALVAEQRLVAKLIGKNTLEWFDLEGAIKSATAQLFDMVLELESINRALGGDLTNPLQQAENEFIEAARALQLVNQTGGGELEKARAQLEKEQAEIGLERARFDVALFDLKFLSETGALGTGGYISALQALLEQVDTSTHQGKQIFLEIQSLIDGLTSDIGDLAFNIPGSIRLPTLFEIRRAVEADSLGVNYIDNRQIDVRVNVETVADLGELLQILSGSLQQTIPLEGQRLATGNAGLTVGPFG